MLKKKIYKLHEQLIKKYLIFTKGKDRAYSFSYFNINIREGRNIYYKNKFLFKAQKIENLLQKVNSKDGEIYILGSGPSVKTQNLQILQNKNVIFLNGSINLASKYQIKPFCYIILDATFIINKQDIIKQIPSNTPLVLSLSAVNAMYTFCPKILQKHPVCLILNPLEPYKGTKKKISDLENEYFYIPPQKDTAFSYYPDKGLFDGGTVMSNAIQIAFYLNFRKIFLLGLDIGNAAQPRFYENDKNKLKSGLLKDYETKILPFMKTTKTLAEMQNRKIYNCSPITKLPYEVIPYFDFKIIEEKNNVN